MADMQTTPKNSWGHFWKRHAPVLANDVDTQRVEIFGLGLAFLGAIVIFSYSGLSGATASWLLCGAACFAVGMTMGFIFAIPRASSRYVNSNLEVISDWLTKILVGVGLTEMKSIPSALGSLATFVAGGSQSSGKDRSFAFFVILYFFFGGFVAAYLETRVFLTGAFFRSDPSGDSLHDLDHDSTEAEPRPKIQTDPLLSSAMQSSSVPPSVFTSRTISSISS